MILLTVEPALVTNTKLFEGSLDHLFLHFRSAFAGLGFEATFVLDTRPKL